MKDVRRYPCSSVFIRGLIASSATARTTACLRARLRTRLYTPLIRHPRLSAFICGQIPLFATTTLSAQTLADCEKHRHYLATTQAELNK